MGKLSTNILLIFIIVLTGFGCSQSDQIDDIRYKGEVYEFNNGKWFNGKTFDARPSVYVNNGHFLSGTKPEATQNIDLDGGFVIPPLCEAHNHNLGGGYQSEKTIQSYLNAGIFHVMIFSNLPQYTANERYLYNNPGSVDVIFANGGLTAPGGHPVKLREMLLGYGVYEGFTKDTLKDHAYFTLADQKDIDDKWPLIMMYRPDFIKIFLLYSEEYETRRDDPAFFGNKGLDPKLITSLVERAHKHGLRVAAHLESAHDFHVAVTAGVDIIAHLPGYNKPQTLIKADIALAAQKNIKVVTTVSLAERIQKKDPKKFKDIRSAQMNNLKTLKEQGVAIAFGSDNFDSNSTTEAAYINNMDIFSNAEILNMWTRDCSKTIFPDRQLGQLKAGFESSFIVLADNPLNDIKAVQNIVYRFKDGQVLQLEK